MWTQAQQKYAQSSKGKLSRKKYQESDKGRETHRIYLANRKTKLKEVKQIDQTKPVEIKVEAVKINMETISKK